MLLGLDLAAIQSRIACSSSTRSSPPPPQPARMRAALNSERYEKAASFFAEDAIVQQTREIRLEDRKDAIAFNRSLPCKADVTDVHDEGKTVIAAFRLRGGPAGGCDGGSVRVRFRFRDGKFVEWRQLGEPQAPPGAAA